MQFVAAMTHELRTPLNAVIGYSEILGEDLAQGSGTADHGDAMRIHAAGLRLLELVDQVLLFSELEACAVRISPTDTHVPALLRTLISRHAEQAARNANVMSLSISEEIDRVPIDAERFGLALGILISNACKFTKNGRIEVSARVDDGVRCCGRHRPRNIAGSGGSAVSAVFAS